MLSFPISFHPENLYTLIYKEDQNQLQLSSLKTLTFLTHFTRKWYCFLIYLLKNPNLNLCHRQFLLISEPFL